MFTTELLLLPCALGNQLLRTGETPFVPSAGPLQAGLSTTRTTAPSAAGAPATASVYYIGILLSTVKASILINDPLWTRDSMLIKI